MVKMATYGFPEGWDYIYNKEKSDSEAKYEDWRYHDPGSTHESNDTDDLDTDDSESEEGDEDENENESR